MMQAIRGKAGSIMVKVLFGLLIISFGLWGVSDYLFLQDRASPETVIAKVGGQEIRAEELRQAMQPAIERMRAQFGGGVDVQMMKQLGIVDSVLGQLIERRLLTQEAERLGLEVSDEVIRGAIYDNPAFRGADGRFDRQLFVQVLMMNRLSEEQLVARLRQEIPYNDLLQALTAGVEPPQPVVEALYRHRNEKRIADVVGFPVSAVSDIGEPSEAVLARFYEAHPELFRAPEYRALTLASLAPGDLQPAAGIPEDRLRSEYDERKDEFETLEQRQIQQILASSEEKAKEVEAALAAGKDWQEAATSAGMDPDAIDLGLLNRREIPRELGDVAFELPPNQPSMPVKTPLGWHILRVVKIEPGKTQSFAEAKPKIAAELQLRQAADRLATIANRADDALAGGAKLEDIAPQYGFKLTTVAAVDEGGRGPDGTRVALPVAPEAVLKSAFATGEGETSRVTDMEDGAIYVLRLDKVTPPQVRPLAEVKDKAIAAWQAEQKREAAAKQAETLAGAVAPGASLAKVAGEQGLTVLAAATLSRTPQPGQPVPPVLVAKLFDAKPGAVVHVADASGGYAAQLKDIQAPETVSEGEAAALAQQLTGELRLDIAGEFTEALRRRYPVEIRRDELDRVF